MLKYEDEIARLYTAQANLGSDDYLHAHSRNRAVIQRQIRSFGNYSGFLSGASRILDWGCRQGVDSCLARMLLGPSVTIDACDVDDASYRAFFEFAKLRYKRLSHPYLLPYEDSAFDAVIAGGVIEHVPHESASLTELYRTLRADGHLIITFLPNRLSYIEAMQRTLQAAHHHRLYSLKQTKRLLLTHGFVPVKWGYHQFLPTLSSTRKGIFESSHLNRLAEKAAALNPMLETLWPFRTFSTNLYIVARKVAVIP